MLRRLSHHHNLVGQCRRHLRRQFSSEANTPKRQLLRAARTSRRLHPKTKETVDYRYREGEESDVSISSMWGVDMTTNGKPASFVPFFDEVDAYLSNPPRQDADPTTKENLSLETLFDDLDQDAAYRDVSKKERPKLLLNDDVTGRRRSILDAFPLPVSTETQTRSPTAFDEEAFSQYAELMNKTGWSHQSKTVAEWLLSDKPLLDYNLATLQQIIRFGVSNADEFSFHDEVGKQRLRFMTALNISSEEYHDAVQSLVVMGHRCAKRGLSLPIKIGWEKIKEAGMLVPRDCLSNYLYVLVTYGIRPRSEGPLGSMMELFASANKERASNPSENGTPGSEDENEVVDVAEEVAAFHDSLYGPTEQSLTIRVKAMIRRGKVEAANNLLNNSNLSKLRLRTFQPIFKLYCDRGEVSAAISLFKRMRDAPGVVLEADTYIQLIAAVVENGFLLPGSPAIEGCVELGFNHPSGPGLLDELMSMLAEDVLEITPGLAKRLHTAVTKAYKGTEHAHDLEDLHPLAPLQLDNKDAGANNVIASRVLIDASTGICPKSRAHLRLISLSYEQRHQLKRGLMQVAGKQKKTLDMKSSKKKTYFKADPERLIENFSVWLDSREGEPFTAIIDGANVGYFLQNFDAGKFNLYQIQFMVQTLEKMGETPLVILPEKYTRASFLINKWDGPLAQTLNAKERSILDTLWNSDKLYVTPKFTQDDHFWMIASISEQKRSRKGCVLDVLPDDPSGRWPGIRPMLVSNDQMKDHKLELIEPRLFRRWYSSHMVNYNLTGFVNAKCVDDEIVFSPADFFSREIQGNETSEGSVTWHFPVRDWEENEYFCLRIPRK